METAQPTKYSRSRRPAFDMAAKIFCWPSSRRRFSRDRAPGRATLPVWRCVTASIHVWISAKILQDLLALLLINHEIHALAAVATLDAALGFEEEGLEDLPAGCVAAPADVDQRLLLVRAETFQQLVIQSKEELATAGVALASGAAGELTVDAAGVVP